MPPFATDIVAVCTGTANIVPPAKSPARRKRYRSAIDKQPRQGMVRVDLLGLAGDEQVDRKRHGGPDQAVHAHFRRTGRIWGEVLGRKLPPGFLGENLALDPGSEEDVCIGDIFQAGTAVLQLSCPRVPCATMADQLGYVDAVAATVQRGCTGFYLRVLEPGDVKAGDCLTLLERPNPGISVAWTNEVYYANKAASVLDRQRLREASGLASAWQAKFETD